jgi:type III secretory pathway component EscR
MKINLMYMDNKQLESHARLVPLNKSSDEIQRILSTSLHPEIAKEVANDAHMKMSLENEFNQLKQDREDLRHIILKRQDKDDIHFPVNIPRIIWNAKEQFKIKDKQVTDLHPNHVLDSLKSLFEDVSAIPGIKVRNDPLIL